MTTNYCNRRDCHQPAKWAHVDGGWSICDDHWQNLNYTGHEYQPIPTPPTDTNPRTQLLADAEQLVNGDRNNQYGPPTQDFKRSADMIAGYLEAPIQPHDVAVIVSIIKMSRIRWSPGKRDSWLDIAGYAACGWDCAKDLGPDRGDL